MIGGSSSGCELCSDWEGEVVSLDGATPGYPTLAEAEGAGLFHPNLHAPAVSLRPRADADERHRPLGRRHVRGAPAAALPRARDPRLEDAPGGGLDDAAARAAQAKVREWQARLREHVEANGLKRLSYREQIGKAI